MRHGRKATVVQKDPSTVAVTARCCNDLAVVEPQRHEICVQKDTAFRDCARSSGADALGYWPHLIKNLLVKCQHEWDRRRVREQTP
jgi:hypothetical protein